MQEQESQEKDFSFKSLFVPFTTSKAIHIIIFTGLVVYFNMLFNGFVLDDKSFIVSNLEIHSFNLNYIFGHSLFNTGYYRPFPALYFTILYSLFKETTFFYHLLQLTLTIINSSLVFLLLSKFFNNKISLFLSLVFLVHPIQVESVSYIASSGNELFFLFGIMAILLSIKKEISQLRLIGIASLLLASLLTRETGFLFLSIILVTSYLVNKRKNLLSLFFVGLSTTIIYVLLRFVIEGISLTKFEFAPIARLSFFERLINIPAIIFYYLKTFFFPLSLASEQQWVVSNIDAPHFYLPLIFDTVFFLLVGLLGVYVYRKNKNYFSAYILFLAWFLLGFLPHLQFFPLDMTVADRWFYFTIVGLLGMIGVLLQLITFKKRYIQRVAYCVLALVIAILSVRTMVRNTNWTDALTLYLHDSKIQTNYEVENNLGFEYTSVGQYKEGLAHYQKSVNFYPYEANLYNMADVYEKMGDYPKAKEYFSKTIATSNTLPTLHQRILVSSYERLSLMLLITDKPKDSMPIIRRYVQLYPSSENLWMILAIDEYYLHDQQKATAAIEKAYQINPTEQIANVRMKIINKLPIEIK